MYLSKVTLLPTTQAINALFKLANNGVYASHQLIWKLFPNQDTRPFLYREEQGYGGKPEFFVLSEVEPKPVDSIVNVKTKIFNPQLHQGDRLAFKIRLNPTICTKNKSGESKRHDVLMHAKTKAKSEGISDINILKLQMEQAGLNWFSDPARLKSWGISLDCLPNIESYQQHRSEKKKSNAIKFSSVNYQGLLTVEQPDIFLQKYRLGFGRAKSMGCGLMLIRNV